MLISTRPIVIGLLLSWYCSLRRESAAFKLDDPILSIVFFEIRLRPFLQLRPLRFDADPLLCGKQLSIMAPNLTKLQQEIIMSYTHRSFIKEER